jgi:hypothetical protein
MSATLLAMPTLIRFAVVLLILAGLAFGAMIALAIFVDPGQKEFRVSIPSSELGSQPASVDPLGIRTPAPATTTTTAPPQ